MNYNLEIGEGIIDDYLREYNIKLIICDENVMFEGVNVEKIEISEQRKNINLFLEIIEILEKYGMNRNDTCAFIGGGVLIDVASFAACTYKRGINYINVPTTTLAMIDSSVGGKNGINYNGSKNLLGVIRDPNAVIIDVDFLETLDQRNYNNGICEAIKIGYLSNPALFELLKQDDVSIIDIIELAVGEKLRYVKADKNDFGIRNHLNFGHTFGHAIESYYDYKRYYHGEAVSLGMVIASDRDLELINVLKKWNLPVLLPADCDINSLIKLMHNDKKNSSDKIKIIKCNGFKASSVELKDDQILKMFQTKLTVYHLQTNKIAQVNKSKSYIHRYMLAALAFRKKICLNLNIDLDYSEDVVQSLEILKACGGKVKVENDKIFIDCNTIYKPSGIKIVKSATTYRLFAPVLCSLFDSVDIEICEQLQKRPHKPFEKYIENTIHSIGIDENTSVDGSISSQFISGYLFAIAAKYNEGKLQCLNGITSMPYLQMTMKVLNEFGFVSELENYVIHLKQINNHYSNERLSTEDYINISVEDDCSSLATLFVYNQLAQLWNREQLVIPPFPVNTIQADAKIVEFMNASTIDLETCPDLLPILISYGILGERKLNLINTSRIKFKECDRISIMNDNLQKLGASIKVHSNNIEIEPCSDITNGLINCAGDHRIAFAFTIIGMIVNSQITLDDYSVVSKSFPTFFEQIGGY